MQPWVGNAELNFEEVREAARRVAAGWSTDGDDSLATPVIATELDRLIHMLQTRATDADENLGAPPHGFLRRRLLEKTRSELISLWAQAPEPLPPEQILALLSSFDHVARALDPRPQADAFARGGAPNGLELLVEVAHDFRSPLTSIMYLSETLRRGQGGALSELQRRQIGIVYNAALTLISTASDVIELASAGENLADPEPRPFSMAETLESVHGVVHPIAEE
ncbi:MAG TPA: histidine kinase dimerization/phospho-acceptor domain-containing protein, partial [Longimicrobiales bacterium]